MLWKLGCEIPFQLGIENVDEWRHTLKKSNCVTLVQTRKCQSWRATMFDEYVSDAAKLLPASF